MPEVGRAVVGLAERRARDAAELGDGRGDGRPAEAGRPLVRLGERPAGQEDGRDRQLVGRRVAEVVGEEGGLLGGSGRRREALGELAPATHGGDGIPCRRWCTKPWFPEALTGTRVVLRRHVPANLAAFRRWYADPEIARLARYQATPMRPEEIERFFAARVVGPDALAMAVHEQATDRLIGTCAFSQLDGDNGSALYHITIGEADAWGQGYGTEATQLMLDHAFGTLGLHRVALTCSSSTSGRSGPTGAAGSSSRAGARVDLARRPLVGRAGDERPRVGLAGDARGGVAAGDGRAVAEADGRRRLDEPVGAAAVGPAAADAREVAMTTDGAGGRGGPGRGPRADRGEGPHGRQRPGGRRPARRGVRRRRPGADRRRWTCTSAT